MFRADPAISKPPRIELDGISYPVVMRRSPRAKSVILSADAVTGSVKLTLPPLISEKRALNFARSKSEWLRTCFAEAPQPQPIANGQSIGFLGESKMVRWSPDFFRRPELVDDEIRLGGPESKVQDRVIDWLKARARHHYAEDLAEYCKLAGAELPKLSIGDARRRWGSCSGAGAIRLNLRLIMAPPLVRRSVVAHEVAHLRHMNHSRAFYQLLDNIFEGDRKKADGWLKNHGKALYMVGAPARLTAS